MKKKRQTKKIQLKISGIIHKEDCIPKPARIRNNYFAKKDSISIPLTSLLITSLPDLHKP
jgi:hypothetical protein